MFVIRPHRRVSKWNGNLPPKSWIIWRRGRFFCYLPPPKRWIRAWVANEESVQISKLYLPTFLAQRREFFILGEPVFSNTTRLYSKISEDVPNNSKVSPKKIIMLHMDLHKSEILGKVSSFTHYSWIFSFLILYWFFLSWHIFGKCVSLGCNSSHFPRREKLVRKREIEVCSPRARDSRPKLPGSAKTLDGF